ncbi:hypothetical protein E3T46_04595 [Cryobacterium sp. Hh11]|uniref:hypothetical protein n=1 Tax=unclassified Cryobacterium TaxID=2649013 RepID=UPI000CE452C1|nr:MULTISPECIES: hypothetical protein [unclassified Cryobacterium]TFD53217.1 hypothetical protein E3T46_04595 [Cryobacterium sp. Hh11]
MLSEKSSKRQTVAKIAAAARWGNPSPEIAVAHRDLAAERLADYITKVVSKAPPLTPEQRDRLASLLRPVGRAA